MKKLKYASLVIGIALIAAEFITPGKTYLEWFGIAIIFAAFFLFEEKKEENDHYNREASPDHGESGQSPEAPVAKSSRVRDRFVAADIRQADKWGFTITENEHNDSNHFNWNEAESYSWCHDSVTMYLRDGGWIDLNYETKNFLQFVMHTPSQEEKHHFTVDDLRINVVDSDGVTIESPESKFPFRIKWNDLNSVIFSKEEDSIQFVFHNGNSFGTWEKLKGLPLLLLSAPAGMRPEFPDIHHETKVIPDCTIASADQEKIVIELSELLVEMEFSWSDISDLEWIGNYWAVLRLKSGEGFDISYDDRMWYLLLQAPRGFKGLNYILRDRLFLQLSPCKICGCIAVPTQVPAIEFTPPPDAHYNGDDDPREEILEYNFCFACETEVWTKPDYSGDGYRTEEEWIKDEQLYNCWLYEEEMEERGPEKIFENRGFRLAPNHRIIPTKSEIKNYIQQKKKEDEK